MRLLSGPNVHTFDPNLDGISGTYRADAFRCAISNYVTGQ